MSLDNFSTQEFAVFALNLAKDFKACLKVIRKEMERTVLDTVGVNMASVELPR